jgi:hypothetical protein
MRRPSIALIAGSALVAVMVAGLPTWRTDRARALTNCTTTEDGLTAGELQMLSLINGARASAGLGALKVSPNLNRAAAWKSADPSGQLPLSHTDSLGRAPFARGTDCGYPGGMAENIAWGYPTAQATFDAWMGSTGHRANILNPNYVVIGLGEHSSAWTTDFGLTDDSGSPSPPPAPTTSTVALPPKPTNTPFPTSAPAPTATAVPAPGVSPAGISLPLAAGVNIVTFAGPARPASEALASIRASVIEVSAWDNASQSWRRFAPWAPDYANSFTMFEPGGVYYLRMAYAAVWIY